PTNRPQDAFYKWAKNRNIRSRLPGRNTFNKQFLSMAVSLMKVRCKPGDASDLSTAFKNPGIDRLRDDWNKYIGGKHEWSKG
ncbi:MAG: hypothetical protein EB015_14720, partial [Methylocystaceae bacterium]|nr:hypothetical protein [Methylocystaceae bacterium]